MPSTIEPQDSIITLTLYPNQQEISYFLPPSSIDETNDRQTNQIILPIEYLVTFLWAIILTIIVFFYFKKKRKPNVEKIFKDYPQLSKEVKAVLQFLTQNAGRAFDAEIREIFSDLPRTSFWRLVWRLERMEIVEIKKIELENQVKRK